MEKNSSFSKEEIRIIARELLLYLCSKARSPSEAFLNLKIILQWTRDIWFAGDEIKRIIFTKMGIKYSPSSPWYYGAISKVSSNSISRLSWRDYIIEISFVPRLLRVNKTIMIKPIDNISYSENYLLLVIEDNLRIYYKSLQNEIYSGIEITDGTYYSYNYYRIVERKNDLLICKTTSTESIFYVLDGRKRLSPLFTIEKYEVLLCFTHGYIYPKDNKNLFQKYEGGKPYIIDLPNTLIHRNLFSSSFKDVDIILSNNFHTSHFEIFIFDSLSHSLLWKFASQYMIRVINSLVIADRNVKDLITGETIYKIDDNEEIMTITQGEGKTEWTFYNCSVGAGAIPI